MDSTFWPVVDGSLLNLSCFVDDLLNMLGYLCLVSALNIVFEPCVIDCTAYVLSQPFSDPFNSVPHVESPAFIQQEWKIVSHFDTLLIRVGSQILAIRQLKSRRSKQNRTLPSIHDA